MLISFTFECNF